MPVIRVRKRRASLRRLLRAKYASVEEEKAAMEEWVQSQTYLWHADALNQYARIGLPVVPLRFWGGFIALFCSTFLCLWRGMYLPGTSVFLISFMIGEVFFGGLGLVGMLPVWLGYLLHPKARRAALWLAWLGNKEGLPYLLRALRLAPLTRGQRAWAIEVETALMELLDLLPPEANLGEDRRRLEKLLTSGYRKRHINAPPDFTPSRAYLLAAIVRYLYGDHLLGEAPRVLQRILAAPADPVLTPNRYLVREVAALYYAYPVQAAPAASPFASTTVPFIETVALLRRRR